MPYIFTLMSETDALTVISWRYAEPYNIYNMDNSPAGLAEMLERRSPHYAVHNGQNELTGFFAFGTSAQLWESDAPGLFSENNTLTIGLGLRPDLTGKGLGLAFLNAGLDFARDQFQPTYFRLFVLTFNERAIKVYERAGFQKVGIYVQRNGHNERNYWEMRRKA